MRAHEKENELGRLILKLANTIIKNRNRHLEIINLTNGQADALQFFLANENSTVTDWKKDCGITHQTASGIVRRLEEKGFVTLSRSAKDARQLIVTPTKAAQRISGTMTANRERTGGKLLNGMTHAEQEDFIRLLKIAYENVRND